MNNSLNEVVKQIVEFLMQELTPYASTMYIFLFYSSHIKSGKVDIRIGKRTIAQYYSKGSRGAKTNFAHVTKVLKELESKGCIKIGDTNRDGTQYTVLPPNEIPIVKKRLSLIIEDTIEEDYFTNEQKREEVFERDDWLCYYCGEKVDRENATLDHLIPQSKGGKHTKENLKTSCLICNSIKAGKSYDEAAPILLKSIQERRHRNKNSSK